MKTPIQRYSASRACAIALLALTGCAAATAGAPSLQVTRGAIAAATTMGAIGGGATVDALRDRSGLSQPYINGSSDFAVYTAGTTTEINSATSWLSDFMQPSGFVSFDLGAIYAIDGMAWFGLPDASTARVNSIKVYADNDLNGANGNAGLLFTSGAFDAPAGTTLEATRANVFSFAGVTATRYITVEIVGNVGDQPISGLSEVVFRQNTAALPVPEPATYALLGMGLLAIGGLQRRRMAAR